MGESVEVVGFWVSPFAHRVRWALKLKGVEYEYIEEDIYLQQELNPMYKKVLVLVHDGKPLPESWIILEYIDETWTNNPLLPQESYARAPKRFWANFVDPQVMRTAWFALCSEGEKQERVVKLTIEALEKVEKKLEGKTFFGGEKIGYLDLVFGFVTYWLPTLEEVAIVKILDPLKFPAIIAWSSNFLNHEVIKAEYVPPKDEMIAYFQLCRKELILFLRLMIGKTRN